MARGSRGDSNHADREFTLADLLINPNRAVNRRRLQISK